MKKPLTISKENYLKLIYILAKGNGNFVSLTELSKELNVTKSAVTEMSKKLYSQGCIKYVRYKGIKILPKGKKVALKVIRNHRLWELFLVETLGLSWDEVHLEAEKLEHFSSDFLIDKIDKHLKYPKLDPHGEPIPSKDGSYRLEIKDIPMAECEIGKQYKISRVNDREKELIKYLSQINIKLNKKIKIIDKLKFDNSIIIDIDGKLHSLSSKLVNNIYMTKIKG
jgi:DtxR family Mn-dependent transcriptional regulator